MSCKLSRGIVVFLRPANIHWRLMRAPKALSPRTTHDIYDTFNIVYHAYIIAYSEKYTIECACNRNKHVYEGKKICRRGNLPSHINIYHQIAVAKLRYYTISRSTQYNVEHHTILCDIHLIFIAPNAHNLLANLYYSSDVCFVLRCFVGCFVAYNHMVYSDVNGMRHLPISHDHWF